MTNAQTDGTGNGLATPDQTSPDQTSQQGSPENTQQTPQYVTLDDLKQFGNTLAERIKQGDRDRTKRIEGELSGIKQLLEKPGVQLNDQQVSALREEIAQRIDSETEDLSQAALAQQPQTSYDQVITGYINSVMAEVGTTVTQQDPEWQGIKTALDAAYAETDGAKGLAKVTSAISAAALAKKNRVAANQETASARVSGGITSSIGTPDDATASDLWKQAYKK